MPRRADAAKVFEVTNPDILGLFGRQEVNGKPVSYSYNDCEPFLSEIGKQAGLATQTEAQTRNAFQRGILKLRDALRIYLLLKNSIQAEDSPDFARELQAFDQVLQPGGQALRDREANRSFDQQELLRLVWFTKRYQILKRLDMCTLSRIRMAGPTASAGGTCLTHFLIPSRQGKCRIQPSCMEI